MGSFIQQREKILSEAPKVFCPKEGKKVPVWHCLGSFMQQREQCEQLIEAEVKGTEEAKVKCRSKAEAECHLILKYGFYDRIKEGMKKTEYRDNTEYWRKRIRGRKFVTFHRGYSKETMTFEIALITEDEEQILIHLGKRADEG